MKIIIFGTGVYYQRRKNLFQDKETEIIAFIDNNSLLWGKEFENVKICPPYLIQEMEYDFIVLMSIKYREMKEQLLELGVDEKKIVTYEKCLGLNKKNKLEVWINNKEKGQKAKILLAVNELNNTGTPIICMYSALVLKNKGYNVSIIASNGDKDFIDELSRKGINIILYGNLIYAKVEELYWVEDFKYILANGFSLINWVYEVNKIKGVIWWLHESGDAYENVLFMHDKKKLNDFSNVNVYAVSNVSKEIYNKLYPDVKVQELKYGLPEMKNSPKRYNKLIFAIVGYVSEIKGQDIFLEAIDQLKCSEEMEFWIIGKVGENGFSVRVKEKAKENSNIKILDELNRKEIQEAYAEIDVVVGPSRNDSFPTAIVEGMMNRKICITSEVTGLVQYIEDGKNGFVCKKEDVADLAQKMQWIIDNRDKLDEIRNAARKTYEENFTMEIFGNNLEKVLLESTK